MVLTDREIEAAIAAQQLIIDPVPKPDAFSSTAVDLTLAPLVRTWKEATSGGVERIVCPADPTYKTNDFLKEFTEPRDITGGFTIDPGAFLLAWTAETVNIPFSSGLAARVEGKSSLARLGIGVHVTAPTIHSGFKCPIQLEVCNHGKWKVKVLPGMRVCQIIFEVTLGTPNTGYQGQFQGQIMA